MLYKMVVLTEIILFCLSALVCLINGQTNICSPDCNFGCSKILRPFRALAYECEKPGSECSKPSRYGKQFQVKV